MLVKQDYAKGLHLGQADVFSVMYCFRNIHQTCLIKDPYVVCLAIVYGITLICTV